LLLVVSSSPRKPIFEGDSAFSGAQAYALKCPGCGADLKVGQTLEVFACMYCGATVAGVGMFFAASSTRRQADARARQLKAELNSAIADIAPDERRLKASIRAKQARLDDARRVADS